MSANRVPKIHAPYALRLFVRALLKVFFRFEALGGDHLPAEGSFLLTSNHQSYLDPILVAAGQGRPVGFMAWDALFRSWWFGPMIRWAGAFPVRPDQADHGAFRSALARLRAGQGLVIFPEAGRSPHGGVIEMRDGVALLALRAGAPIVPVRIEGAWEVWPANRSLPRLFRPIRVHYGPPIHPPAQGRRLDPEARRAAIAKMMDELRRFLENHGDQTTG
jgi:1-acyl-sn-glycerol-3-phosphate acyltransferase